MEREDPFKKGRQSWNLIWDITVQDRNREGNGVVEHSPYPPKILVFGWTYPLNDEMINSHNY